MLETSSETARPDSWTARLRQGLARTRSRLAGLFVDRAVDQALYEEIEAALLAADVGVDATRLLLAGLRARAPGARTAEELRTVLRAMLVELLAPLERPLDVAAKPCVIMLAGVNGAGKTTTAGKLA